ncbi:MAG: AAA family ATPase [Bacteroidales bacterium]|nr:AAA family ATPase [Bacteroidales bacterium]
MFLNYADRTRKRKKRLLTLIQKEESQFCAVYGRRRVGKTFLIRQSFNGNFTFQHTGLANSTLEEQLDEFKESLKNYGLKNCKTPKNWREAFRFLAALLEQSVEMKKVVFIDELSWMDTPKSNFISALEHFGNSWASARKDIVLIVCGSATSWIVSKIIKNYGGLHNRLTEQIYLRPFNLYECECFCKAANMEFSRYDILEFYMALGGIPYYWNFINRELSVSQNIDRIFFSGSSPLKNEFLSLYSSLFKNPEPYLKIVRTLGEKKAGMTRSEILSETKMSDNQIFSRVLEELEQCTFIRKYYAFQKRTKDVIYQLIDNYTLFYFRYIQKNSKRSENFYSLTENNSIRNSWSGLAFERVCFWHINQIKQKLGISGVGAGVNSWFTKPSELYDGAQIDLLIDRDDKVINLCEIKFYNGDFVVDKSYSDNLRNKISTFKLATNTKKSVRLTMITVFGVKKNMYSSLINSEITAEDLFMDEIM